MLRIASICRTLPTPDSRGGGVFVLRRLAAMARSADVRVLQPLPYCPGVRPLPRWGAPPTRTESGLEIAHAPMFYVPGVAKSLDGRWLARSIAGPLRRWHRERPLDAIDAHFGYPDGVGAVRVARAMGVPAFVTIRGLEADRVTRPSIRGQLIEALNAATAVVSVSHELRALMIRHGADGDRIHVIANGIEREIYRPGDRAAARAKLGIPADRRLVLCVGHLIRRKRQHVLLQALTRLPGVHLAFVGGKDHEADYPGTLHALVAQHGLGDRVHFVGAVPPAVVADWMRACDVFALTTAAEGCCNAILEALATGMPVVTTPVGDNAYYVRDRENGRLVPVDAPEPTAEAIADALATRWDAARISAGLTVGPWESVAAHVLALFRECLGAQRTGARAA